VFACVVVLDV